MAHRFLNLDLVVKIIGEGFLASRLFLFNFLLRVVLSFAWRRLRLGNGERVTFNRSIAIIEQMTLGDLAADFAHEDL